jgi:hypothetical protein
LNRFKSNRGGTAEDSGSNPPPATSGTYHIKETTAWADTNAWATAVDFNRNRGDSLKMQRANRGSDEETLSPDTAARNVQSSSDTRKIEEKNVPHQGTGCNTRNDDYERRENLTLSLTLYTIL